MGTGPRPYLTFRVARQDLAIEAGRVRGILPLSALEPMPGVRPGLLGITSLNGQIVGVMDLRSKLKMTFSSHGSQPKIVILELTAGKLAGFVADRISDLVVYRDRDLRSGSLRGKGRPRKLVDLNQLITEQELEGLWVLSP